MQAARQGGRSARQGVVSRLDAAVRCSRRRRSLRGLPLGTAARPRSPFSGGRGRHPIGANLFISAWSSGSSSQPKYAESCGCRRRGGSASSPEIVRQVPDHARQRERRFDSARDLVEHELEITPRAAGTPAPARHSPRGKSCGRGGSVSPPAVPRTVSRRAKPWRSRRRTSAHAPTGPAT